MAGENGAAHVFSPSQVRRALPAMAASQSRSRKAPDGPAAEEKIVAALIELMEAGSAPWRRPWDGSGGGHHVNLLSGHRYRGANPILLTLGRHIRLVQRSSRCDGSALPGNRLWHRSDSG